MGLGQFEDLESQVLVFRFIRIFILELLDYPADALLPDFGDSPVAGLVDLGVRVGLLRHLHQEELAVPAVHPVQVQHRMGGGGGAGEEVEDDVVIG